MSSTLIATRAGDKGSLQAQLEHLQMKFVGTGHPDISKYEWIVNQHRDSCASYIGHHGTLAYFAIAENESIGRIRYNIMQNMIAPCGPPPPPKDAKKKDYNPAAIP